MLLALLVLGKPRLVDVPSIARIAGITVGATTIPQFERRYREGLPYVGGHPNGQRAWYDRTTHARIDADGFNFWGRGEILDGVSVSWGLEKDVPGNVPRIRLRRADLGILAQLRQGLSATQVERALHLKLKDGTATVKGLIKYPQKPVNKDNDRYTTWQIHCNFGPKGLLDVDVSGD